MKHKLCMWLLFSMSFLMAFATMEKHGSPMFCAETSAPSVESFGQEVTYWTSDTPYFFFTSDYIAPLSFALDEGSETSCFKYMAVSERLSGFPYASVGCFLSPCRSLYYSYDSGPGRDYYVFTLRRIRGLYYINRYHFRVPYLMVLFPSEKKIKDMSFTT